MTTTLSLVCVGIRTAVLTVSMLAMCAACTQTPSGPTTNVNGDHNTTVVGGSGEGSGNDVVTPAPVVVPPVVVQPVITEGGEG